MAKEDSSQKGETFIKVLRWIFSILIGLTSLGFLFSGSFLSFIFLLLSGALLFPSLTNFWRRILPFLKNRFAKGAIVVVVFIVGIVVSNDNTTNPSKTQQRPKQTVAVSENSPETVKKKPISTIDYKILYTIHQRYDKAPTYFVLINKVDLLNDNFKKDIKNLINHIVTEKGAKISISILDNKKALELMYKSQYGTNTLGRILTKSELAILARHSIADFSGELETGMYPNTLYFLASADKNTSKVGKYVDIIEYNPQISDYTNVKKQKEQLESQKAELEQRKKDFKENYFSSWDGSCKPLVKYVKENMNDPESFEHVETRFTLYDNYAIVIMKFRGKNAYGGTVTNSIKAKVNYDGQVVKIMN